MAGHLQPRGGQEQRDSRPVQRKGPGRSTCTATACPGSPYAQHKGLIQQSGSRVPVFEDPMPL